MTCLLWFVAPFVYEVKDIDPGLDGQVNTLTLRLITSTSFVTTLPLTAAVANNRAEQVQTCWAIVCLYAVIVDLCNTDVDNSDAVMNGILFFIHTGSAFASGSKSRTD